MIVMTEMQAYREHTLLDLDPASDQVKSLPRSILKVKPLE